MSYVKDNCPPEKNLEGEYLSLVFDINENVYTITYIIE